MKHPALLCTLTMLALSGCSVGPDYRRPDITIPASFKEAGEWKPANPQDEAVRGNWWEIYGDAELNALVSQVEISSQNVATAAAQYRQTMAQLGIAQAAYYPTISMGMSNTRSQTSTTSSTSNTGTAASSGIPSNTTRLSFSAIWEPDLWGQISRNVESSRTSAQASSASLQAALLSAQATLVQFYFQLRTVDAQKLLLEQTAAAYERSLEITRNRYEVGVAGRIDVTQAATQLETVRAQAIDLGIQRTQYEHAIAVLMGKSPAELSIDPAASLPSLPMEPVALPSTLLERRPDIASAERRMAAANAQIGVAQSAFFPSLTINGSRSYQSTSLISLLALPNGFWSIGPVLALTLLDGGARTARKESAIASYDEAVATYRQTVLTAFQEVEDNLATLHLLSEEAARQQTATRLAEEALILTENQYQAGTVSYLNVAVAQATALTAQRNNLDIAGRRLVANATLLKALGGGWKTPDWQAFGDRTKLPRTGQEKRN